MRKNRKKGLVEKETSLTKDRRKLRAIFNSSPNAITVTDLEGRIIDCNQATLKMHNFSSRTELIGKNAFELFSKRERKRAMENLKKTLEKGSTKNMEYALLTKDGREFPAELSTSVIIDPSRAANGFVIITSDVTERKNAEKIKADERVRRMMEERLSTLNFCGRKLNTANSLQEVYELTLDAIRRTLGFAHAAFLIIDKGNLQVVSQRGYPTPLSLMLPLNGTKKGITVKAANTRTPVLVTDTTKDEDYVEGVPGIRSELAVPIETKDKLLGVLNVESKKLAAFDIRDMQLLQILASHAATVISNLETRKEIEKRSNQLALLMKSSTKMISSTDLRQRLKTIAEAIKELGWRRVVISVRDKNMEIQSPEDIVTAGLTDEEIEFLWKNKPTGQVWKERFGSEYERFKVGEFYHLPWSDPWVRKKFSDSTIPSKLSPEEMVDWDPQDLLYAPLRLADGSIVGVLSIDDPLDGKRPTKESLAPLELFIHQAAAAIENAQLILNLNMAKEQLKADAEQLELKVKERTKELKKSQEQLLKTQRLATMGELAGMVGHDLRNPLTGMAGATYYLKTKLWEKLDKKAKDMLRVIEKDIEYSNKVVNDLLEYSRELQLELSKTSPKLLLKEALSLVRVPENIRVVNLMQSKPKIVVDVEKMKRVFVNIIKNAVDAMTQGDKLTIKSKKTDANLEVTFADTGTGIPKDVIAKIWTPLFTTKAKGMGLGLPICKRIVESHGGSISVESKIGKGTTFTVTFPIKPKFKGGEKTWLQIPESLLSMTRKA